MENDKKATATIVAQNGKVTELNGDTVIVFTIDKGEKFMNEDTIPIYAGIGIAGKPIREYIFSEVFGDLVIRAIQKFHKDKPTLAAFQMSEISKLLKERSNKIMRETPEDEIKEALEDELNNILNILKHLD